MMVANKHATSRDIDALLQPDPGEAVIRLDADHLMFEDIAVAIGAWPSKGQARKNGWAGRVPTGFGSRKLGKRTVWWLEAVDAQA
jgi:hypothetical protein